jgi:hypothetical protein
VPDSPRTRHDLDDMCLHEIARALYYVKHETWGYDPGNPKHEKWFERAIVFSKAASLGCHYISNTDRPATRKVQMIGVWRQVPSPARDLRRAA